MNDIQTTYRSHEGSDYPHSDPWAATPRSLLFGVGLLSGLSGLFIGWLSFAIFVTT